MQQAQKGMKKVWEESFEEQIAREATILVPSKP